MGMIVRDFDAEERADMRREAEFTARRIGLHHATCRRQSGDDDGRLGKAGYRSQLSARVGATRRPAQRRTDGMS